MNRIVLSFLSLCILLFLVACSMDELPTASTSTQTDSATPVESKSDVSLSKMAGNQIVNGHVEVPVDGIIEKYSFSAVRHKDGTVTGEWQVHDKYSNGKDGKISAHGNVTCFTIQPDGKTVWLGGIIEKNNFGFPEGSEANWTVIDNGKEDLATDLTFGWAPGSGVAESHCETGAEFNNIPPTPIVRGNIKVKN